MDKYSAYLEDSTYCAISSLVEEEGEYKLPTYSKCIIIVNQHYTDRRRYIPDNDNVETHAVCNAIIQQIGKSRRI